MKWKDLISDGYGRTLELMEQALEGLTENDLNWQPRSDCNSLGWIAWHLTRVQDAEISGLMGEGQLWDKGEWHLKFHRAPEPEDTGYGHTPEQVQAFKSPPVGTLLDYHRDVLERTKRFLYTLSESELARELNEPWFKPLPTVGIRLVSVMSDCAQHAGEMTYLRGLLKGKGWLDA